MERRTGSTRMPASPRGQGGEDELLRAVREAAAAEYDILGEMGRGERGRVVYLARERASDKLVALKLRPDGDEYELSILRELDASVPALRNECPSCKTDLVGWGRFCSQCGKDLSDMRPVDASHDEQLRALQAVAEGEYDVLGEMQRSDGGGAVYFARELSSARLVALQLVREPESNGTASYALQVTQLMKPLVASLGATYTTPTSTMQAGSVPPTRAAAPSPRSPQPTARSATPPSVIVPDYLAEAEQPPAPEKRLPLVPLGILAGVLVVAGAALALSRSRHDTPDPASDPATNVVIPAEAAPAPSAAPPAMVAKTADSGAIVISSLPASARVTLNGKPVTARQLSLPPGRYQLAVSAPGYRTASQRVDLASGQTISWAPAMQITRPAAKAAPATPSASPKVVSSMPNCFNAFSEKTWTAALLSCTREANAGNQSAQRNLGAIYDQGLGVTKDAGKAAIWYRKAAETGNRDATFQLATMYEDGRGVPQDSKQALDWYRKAALLGDADSQLKLGRAYADGKMVNRDDGEASAWFQRAADQGNPYALNRLGAMYLEGRGVHKDDARAFKMFEGATSKGDAQGQFNLAAMYAKGRGVQKSDSAANDLYIKAARQGYADAVKEARRRNLKF
jgi:TPR repeat protein